MKKCIFCLFFLMLQVSYSQFYQINNGIFGCEIKSVAISGNNVFVGLYEKGVYFSSDNGNTWYKKDSSFFNRINKNRIYSIVSDRDNIFVCAENGLYLTTDLGESWEDISKVSGYTTGPITAITVKGDSIYGIFYMLDLYLSTNYGKKWITPPLFSYFPDFGGPSLTSVAIKGDNIFIGRVDGILKINQDGREMKNSGLLDTYINAIIVKDNNLFVGTRGGVFMSPDDGEKWIEKNFGLTNLYINSLVIDGENIFAATNGGIFFSSDNGETWFDKNKGLSILNVNSLAIKGNIIYAGTSGGIFLSTDYGENWTNKTHNLNILPRITKLAFKQDLLFAGTYGNGVFRSTDLGDNWVQKISGLEGFKISHFAVDEDRIFMGTDNGVYLSTDNGDTWLQKNSGLTSLNISSVLIKGNYIFASTYDKGIFASTNNGESWEARNNNLPILKVRSLANVGDILFAGTDGDPSAPDPEEDTWPNGWICSSTDNGDNWQILSQENGSITVLKNIDGYLFKGTDNGPSATSVIEKSSDFGRSWTRIGGWVQLIVNDIISYEYYVFAAVEFNCIPVGIINYGEMKMLQRATLPPPYYRARALAISPDDKYFYVGTDSGGIYRNTPSYIVRVNDENIGVNQYLYPNPARDYVYFNSTLIDGVCMWEYQIYDILGNCVQSGAIESDKINISQLSSGFYTVRFFNGSKQVVEKLMKE